MERMEELIWTDRARQILAKFPSLRLSFAFCNYALDKLLGGNQDLMNGSACKLMCENIRCLYVTWVGANTEENEEIMGGLGTC